MATMDRLVQLEDGPFTHMIDTLVPTARVEGAYTYGQNVYPADSELGEALVGRPGSRPAGAQFPDSVRGMAEFTTASGESWRACIAGGELYAFDWATELWTLAITTADLTTAGITVFVPPAPGSSGVVAMVPAFDKLLVSDGFNAPFLWDGTTGGGLTALTNCPPLYGVPTVHQARLFGVKTLDRRTIVWSEADDPTTGYQAGGFSNAWTLRQTDAHPLTRVVGTNQGLVIFRARSVTMAVGDVGDDTFQSSDSQEAIDVTVGTNTPFAVVPFSGNIVFLDADLRPQLLRPGATGVIPLWHAFRNTLAEGSSRALPSGCFGAYYTPASLLLFSVPTAGLGADVFLVLSATSEVPRPVAVWTGWGDETGDRVRSLAMMTREPIPTSGGLVSTGAGLPVLLRGTMNGYAYLHGNPDDATFLTDDVTPSGSQPIYHLVHGQPLGYSTKREKVFDRVDASFRSGTVQSVTLWVRTPRGDADPYTLDVEPADSELETKVTLGLDETGRWIAPRIAHQTAGEEFGLVALSVTAYAASDDPESP